MRIAFYAPLKSPTHATPSGDRRVGRLLMDALLRAGQRIELVSTFRSYDGKGEPARQQALREQGEAHGRRLAEQWRDGPAAARPELWFTYHLYYKAPDWLGPQISRALGIPYVLAEPSYAPKRAGGPWAIGHDATAAAIRSADLVLSPSHDDIPCLQPLIEKGRLVHLPPFLHPEPYREAMAARNVLRGRLAQDRWLDPAVPWIVAVAMMREGDKLASYRALARCLAQVNDLPWRLLVAGDGPARAEVQRALDEAVPGRACFLGLLNFQELSHLYAASDLCAWPAVNEAYGMALLEAQAAGLPVVSSALRGVPDVVVDGRTGLLAPGGDEAAFAERIRALLVDAERRRSLGREAARFVASERSLDAAARSLGDSLNAVARR